METTNPEYEAVERLHDAESAAAYWKHEALQLRSQVRQLQATHDLMQHRDWFAIGELDGKDIRDAEGRWTLFYCTRDGTSPLCTLGPKDVLLVGRYDGEPEREMAVRVLAGEEPLT